MYTTTVSTTLSSASLSPPSSTSCNYPSSSIFFRSHNYAHSSSSLSISKRRQEESQQLCVSFNPSGNYDLSIYDEDEKLVKPPPPPPSPPKEGRYQVVIDNDIIRTLNLTPFHNATGILSPHSVNPMELLERTIGFSINYIREDEYDPRELSEYPDIRLWFVRLDSTYPWLPLVLDWRAGELARYAAMLVPHQMSMKMGVVFNPEALELFIMKKVFIIYSWLKEHDGIDHVMARNKTKDMARMLGFGIGDELFQLIDQDHNIVS